MNYKILEEDSGNFINGVYTTKNGFSGSGLNCPKGGRLYDTNIKKPIIFVNDLQNGEEFRALENSAAPGVMPYYAISNYGRIMNTYSGKYMKPNYRPNGYEYFCLACHEDDKGKRQKKYSTSRMVMMTYEPREDANILEVNHINGDKSQNYINKIMPDGSIKSSIEWTTPSENCKHRDELLRIDKSEINHYDVDKIRQYHIDGYSYEQIHKLFYQNISVSSIQRICRNKLFYDPDYIPTYGRTDQENNPANVHKLIPVDVKKIRELYRIGYSYEQIKSDYYPDFSISAISDIIRGKTHIDVK